MSDLIKRQDAIIALLEKGQSSRRYKLGEIWELNFDEIREALATVQSSEPERLTDDDFETIRIHLNAYKEKLCNQRRWKEADEYQRIIDRFMAFASAEPKKGKWLEFVDDRWGATHYYCSECGEIPLKDMRTNRRRLSNFCPNCGARMEVDHEND